MPNVVTALKGTLYHNHSLAPYTTWGVGGPAQYAYIPHDLKDLVDFLQECPAHLPITWLGLGSNVLIRDGGIEGVVVLTQKSLNEITEMSPGLIRVEAGVPCAKLAKFATKKQLAGAAFFAGIPGTIGGALYMNAGAFGGETWSQVTAVETLTRDGIIHMRLPETFKITYRETWGLAAQEWFVAGHFQFEAGQDTVQAELKNLLRQRNDSQPIGLRSCGSVFRNPEGDHAARLIEASGLKGKTIGGACISEKHANFIINQGAATAQDIEDLIETVQNEVARQQGVRLVLEAKLLGTST